MEITPTSLTRVESAPKVKLIVPKGWGNGRIDPDIHQEYIMLGVSRDTIQKNLETDCVTRKFVESLGIKIEERDPEESFIPDIKNKEYCVRGREIDLRDIDTLVREAAPEIKIPKLYAVDEFMDGKVTIPIVVSYRYSSGGTGKFLIENEEQKSKFIEFLKKEGEQARKGFDIKEYIETPSNRYTSYRVMVSATGTIMASGMLYSNNKKDSPKYIESDTDPKVLGTIGSDLLDWLTTKSSPYYLRSRKFISNLQGGGKCIPLNPTTESRPINEEEREILKQHDILGQEMKLPEAVASQASRIGASVGRKIGLLLGVDFIQNKDGSFYYLEINPMPGMQTYIDARKKGVGDPETEYRLVLQEVLREIINN